MAIAVRAALRVLPLLATDRRDEAPSALILPCCRAMAGAWVAGTWPTQAAEVRDAAARAADAAARAADAAARATDAAARATDAAA
ncbi:MAG: hypothetical protein P1U88_12720, partial [Thalassobaculaceae bacterium]|nr:hypothetical protein [Thalassobaculaceae bacterium]